MTGSAAFDGTGGWSDRLSGLLAFQGVSGAFPALVGEGPAAIIDETGFVTACVALELPPGRARERALDFVERCEWPDRPGAFAYYPAAGRGPRAAGRLGPDADDTALAWLALLAGGRRSTAAARFAFEDQISRAALAFVPGDAPPWVRTGAVRTWIDSRGRDNPVDLAVNANVAALAARVGCQDHPAAIGARASLLAAARGGYDPAVFARRLAPYYASICELEIAVARAVALGASDLALCLEWLSRAGTEPLHPDKPLFCDWHGQPVWRSPALQCARALAAARVSPSKPGAPS